MTTSPVLDFTPEPRVAAGVRVAGTGTAEIARLIEAAANYAHAVGEREIDAAGHALMVLAEELGLHGKRGSFVTNMLLDGPGAPAVAQLTAAIHAYAKATEDNYLEAGAALCAAVEALEDLKKSQAVVTATLPGGHRRRPDAVSTPAEEEEPMREAPKPGDARKLGTIDRSKFNGPKHEELWIRIGRVKETLGGHPYRVRWQQRLADGRSSSGIYRTAEDLDTARSAFDEAINAAEKRRWAPAPILGRGVQLQDIPEPGAGVTGKAKKR